jgi:hypothetical protein
MPFDLLEMLASVLKRFAHELEEHAKERERPCPPECPPAGPAYKIPDRLAAGALATALQTTLAGNPADGSPPPAAVATAPAKVVWVDHGDEVLVHLDSLKTEVADGRLLVSLDLESDQTGRTPLVMAFALGGANDPAGLVAVTETYPRGNALLASRWGEAVQAAVWSGLLNLAQDHANERGSAPRGIAAVAGTLQFHAGPVLKAS